MAWKFNGSTQPQVPAGRWGQGVVLPGEGIEVDNPEAWGAPWVDDPEAEKALLKRRGKRAAATPPAEQNDSPEED